MESYTSIAVSQRGSLRSILLNRPRALNAFDPALWTELEHALRQAGEDEAVRCVVVRGSGTHFSAGYDLPSALDELEGATPAMIRTHIERGNRACWAAWRLGKPVIAAVEGYCLGGGFEFAMACDFVLSDETGRFGEPEGRVAASAPFLVTPWVMGMRHAKEILLSGDIVSAERAERMGIVNEVCMAGGLDDCVSRWSRKLQGFDSAVVELCFAPSPFRDELARRVKTDGFSAAMKWVQARYE